MNNKLCEMKQTIFLCFLAIFVVPVVVASVVEKEDCTDLARDEETLLVFSTLGGGLTAIDPVTSEIRWTIDDEPAVKSAVQPDSPLQQYLPDPRDGSLYQLGDMGDLKKLPYTIPQLVANAPCRSSDGILYSGKKSDTWFLIDPKTGRREKVMGFGSMERTGDHEESIGWATSRSIYLGRTQYTVMMYDSLGKGKNIKPWNITFFDYASHTMAPEISSDYDYIHLAGSSSGLTVTLDREGNLIWQKDMTSPVIAVFLLASEGLLSVPFSTVSDDALRNIVEESKQGGTSNIKLFQTLYVGEHSHGLYALPSLVDKNTATISSDPPVKLLEGPHKTKKDFDQKLVYLNDLLKPNKNIILLGHYQVPKTDNEFKIQLTPSPAKNVDSNQLATVGNMDVISNKNDFLIVNGVQKNSIGVQTENNVNDEKRLVNKSNNEKLTGGSFLKNNIITKILLDSKEWLTHNENGGLHQLVMALITIVLIMMIYTCTAVRNIRQQTSQNGSQTTNRGSGSGSGNYQEVIDLGFGEVQVGKICFNSNEVIGKGCEGTFVFKGTFEERNVAVKRLLPECFSFADREVSLLRESDAHENVVRYFCTEQDRQFRYIAVELCAATLQDYIESKISDQLQAQIEVWDVLKQATNGVIHLHSLNIVHRDIKPQNVLLSLPDVNNCVRVMISDFGLCKKLNIGKASFSRRSGVTGTEGWIAPEMIRGQRTTTSVDIFSLGCVFYYVLSKGSHAFGDTLNRQVNILSNEYDLSKLEEKQSEHILARQVISDMINKDPQKRPTAKAIYAHPIFWDDLRILTFLQDVSDRVEKLLFSTDPLKTLEKNGRFVVKQDWNLHLDKTVTDDLRKHRGYMGASVRDLLRACRNKKHHYHELSVEVQSALGSIPKEFTKYWISRFPHLLSHAYHAFTICRNESQFHRYYDINYHFKRPDYFTQVLDEEPLHDNPKLINVGSPKKHRKGSYKRNSSSAGKVHANGDSANINNSNFTILEAADNTRTCDDGEPSKSIVSNIRLRNRGPKPKILTEDSNLKWAPSDAGNIK